MADVEHRVTFAAGSFEATADVEVPALQKLIDIKSSIDNKT